MKTTEHLPLAGLGSFALPALGCVVTALGCSAPADTGYGFADDSGTYGSSSGSSSGPSTEGGSTPNGAHVGSGSGGSSSGVSSSSSGGLAASSSSSSSGGSGSGSSSGSSSSSGSTGGMDAGGHDASASNDTGSSPDATMTPDTGGTGNDAGLCDNASDWLTPMNQARAMVNAGEPPLVCDPIAAQVALNYANKCNFAHNMNRNSDYTALGGSGGLGENIAAGGMLTVSQAVNLWVSEQQYYDHATNTCASGQQCGHYTQVVWKTTTAAGCALVTCTTNSPFGGGSWQFGVCDFSPPGNYVGQPPY